MSWMEKLYETYQQAVLLDLSDDDKLIPVSHTQQNAHINIVIDGEGNFRRASALEKTKIVLPATEASAGRTSGESPHPFADKLQYVAKDYSQYGGLKKSYFTSYSEQLFDWYNSQYTHPKIKAVYQYISKGQVIEDLINAKIVYVDQDRKLLTSWPYEVTKESPMPLLFKTLPKEKGQLDQGSAMVCWTVEIEGDPNSITWTDVSLQDSWIAFKASNESDKGFCYIRGVPSVLALNHPAKIRHTGDKAKLISSNDSNGYTYRGRFLDDTQAAGISFDVTEKAHSALRWLISRQGYRNADQRIVAWAVSGCDIPDPLKDTYHLIDIDNIEEVDSTDETNNKPQIDHGRDLGQTFAINLNKKMAGYRANLSDFERIMIMAIDSATPGRMSITYYRECFAKEFIDRVESWHFDFAWQQRYSESLIPLNGKKPIYKTIWSISAPAPYVIAEVAYGKALTDSLKKNIFERLMPCILEGRPLPIDILNMCVRRASSCNTGEPWEWERNLGVACALYRGFYQRHTIYTKRRDYSMTLEINNTSRDYLYGRLLAVAERIEKVALSIVNEKRITTAERLMQRFADRPYSTWRIIELSLKPYMQRLQTNRAGFLSNRKKELDEIMSSFSTDQFANDKKLSGEFLLAYHCQRHESGNKSKIENLEEN